MAMQQHPNLSAEDQAIMQDLYVRCRATRSHRLDPIPATARPSFGTYVWYRCENCGMLRFDIVSVLTGDLLSRSYSAPPGYKDTTGKAPREWRAQFYEQLDETGMLSPAGNGNAHRLSGEGRKSPRQEDRPKFKKPKGARSK